MASSIELLADETVLFEGDIFLINSIFSMDQGHGVATSKRFVFTTGKRRIEIEGGNVESVEEKRHGLGVKLAVAQKDGHTLAFQAMRPQSLKTAFLVMTGQRPIEDAQNTEPSLASVRNASAWVAAFGPSIAGLFIALLWGDSTYWRTSLLLKLYVLQLAAIYMFMRIDHLKLQQQGFNLEKLGVSGPGNFPLYLFSRAKAFGHGKAYAIVWCVSFAFEVLKALV